MTTFYKIKAERYSGGNWEVVTLEIIVNDKGKIVDIKETED